MAPVLSKPQTIQPVKEEITPAAAKKKPSKKKSKYRNNHDYALAKLS